MLHITSYLYLTFTTFYIKVLHLANYSFHYDKLSLYADQHLNWYKSDYKYVLLGTVIVLYKSVMFALQYAV